MLKIPNHESRRNEGVWQAAVGPFICQMLRGNQPPCMLPVERGLLAVNKSPDSSWQAATRKGLVKSDKSMLYRVLLTNAPSEQKSETMDSWAQGCSNHWAGWRWSPGARARRGPVIGCVVDWQGIGSTDCQTGVLKYLVSEIFDDAGRSIHEYSWVSCFALKRHGKYWLFESHTLGRLHTNCFQNKRYASSEMKFSRYLGYC